MTSVPASDVAIQVASPKSIGQRPVEKIKGNEDGQSRLINSKGQRSERLQKSEAIAQDREAKRDVEISAEASFGAVVDKLEDSQSKSEPELSKVEVPSPPPLSQELATLLQGVVAASSKEEAVSQKAIETALAAMPNDVETPAISDVTLSDATTTWPPSDEPLSTMKFAAVARVPIDRPATTNLRSNERLEQQSRVAVGELRQDTGFDAPVTVKVNQETKLQDAVPFYQTAVTPARRDASFEPRATSISKTETLADPQTRTAVTMDGADVRQQSDGQAPRSDTDSRQSQSKDTGTPELKSPRAASPAKTLAGTLANVALSGAVDAAPPYQQIRAAVTDAIVSNVGVQRTDYVSMYADRPTMPTTTLKTLELALSPPDLGRVNIKMNLTARDLKLEIDTSKAATAQMLANDQASLKRELLSDNFDLSSVLVSVTNAVSETSAAANPNNADQQSQSNGKSFEQGASSSMNGSREERRASPRQDQPSQTAQPERDADADGTARRTSASALYI